jgi:tetratricopeptide (TPR) repeat protein
VQGLSNYALLLHETPAAEARTLTYASFQHPALVRVAPQRCEESERPDQGDVERPLTEGRREEGEEGEGMEDDRQKVPGAGAAGEGGGALGLGRTAAALALFEEALRLSAEFVPAYLNMAAVLTSAYGGGAGAEGVGEGGEESLRYARELLTRALRIEPQNLDCLASLGVLLAFFPPSVRARTGEGGGNVAGEEGGGVGKGGERWEGVEGDYAGVGVVRGTRERSGCGGGDGVEAQRGRLEVAQRLWMRALDLDPQYSPASQSYTTLLHVLKVSCMQNMMYVEHVMCRTC